MYSPAAMLNDPLEQAGDPGQQDEARVLGRRAGDAHHQRQVADQPVTDSEDHGPERAGPPAHPVPCFDRADLGRRLGPPRDRDTVPAGAARSDGRSRVPAVAQLVPDAGMFALVGGDGRDLGRRALGVVRLLLVALERLDEIRDRLGPEQPGDHDDEPDAGSRRARRRDVDAELRELRRPHVGMTPLVGGDPLEGAGAVRLPFDRREGLVQDDGVPFELEVLQAGLDIDRRHVGMVAPATVPRPRGRPPTRRLGRP